MAHFVSKFDGFQVVDSELDFLQIEAAFLKTNYITFSYSPIATDEQNISEKIISALATKFQFFFIFTGIGS